MKLYKILLLSSIAFLSCNNISQNKKDKGKVENAIVSIKDTVQSEHFDENEVKVVPSDIYTDIIPELKKEVKKGDSSAYISLRIGLLDKYDELYPYAKLMADKYNFEDAFRDVYDCLYALNVKQKKETKNRHDNWSLDYITDEQIKIAIDYLIKAYYTGNVGAKDMLSKYYKYGVYLPKDSLFSEAIKSSKYPLYIKRIPLIINRSK